MTTEAYTSKPEGKIPNSRFPLLVHRMPFRAVAPRQLRSAFVRTVGATTGNIPASTITLISTQHRTNALVARKAGWNSTYRWARAAGPACASKPAM